MKTIDDYMSLPYTIELIQEEDGTWFVSIKELPGCMSAGDTPEEAVEMIRDAQKAWLETAQEEGIAIPEPRREDEFSGKFNLRVPKELHRKLVETADDEEVSLNMLCVAMLSEAFGSRSQPNRKVPGSDEKDQWEEAVVQICKIEKLDISSQKPEVVLANWLQREITTAISRRQGDVLYHVSRMLDLLGEVSPLMHVIADMLMQMRGDLQGQAERRAVDTFGSLEDQIFTETEEERTETRTVRRVRSPVVIQVGSVQRSGSDLIEQFTELVNSPKKK